MSNEFPSDARMGVAAPRRRAHCCCCDPHERFICFGGRGKSAAGWRLDKAHHIRLCRMCEFDKLERTQARKQQRRTPPWRHKQTRENSWRYSGVSMPVLRMLCYQKELVEWIDLFPSVAGSSD